MLIEGKTDKSLLGTIVDEAGDESAMWGDYNTRPAHEKRDSWTRGPSKRMRPGRVDADRLIAILPSREAAFAALRAAKTAWKGAPDKSAEQAQRTADQAKVKHDAEKKQLEEQMQRDLAALSTAYSEAQKAANGARLAMYERMTAAAKGAAEAVNGADAKAA